MSGKTKNKAQVAPSSAPVLPAVKIPGDAGSSALKTAVGQSAPGGALFCNRNWIFALLLFVGTILAYQPVWHAGFIWDDDMYVTGNPLLTASDGLRRIWFSFDSPSQYFPLVYTAFRLEYMLWGSNPAGYHWVNLLLHAANALLVWRLLLRLRVPGAWLAAAIFALHPVQVESVAWITELKNVLMLFFFLLTLLAWVEFLEERTMRRWKFYSLALIVYALALCAKTTACTLPTALLLLLWLKKEPINRRRLIEIAPFVAFGIGMGLLTMWWERYHQGTQGKLFALGLMERILVASRAVWFYAGKLLWPANLTFSYPRWTISATNPSDYGWLLATAVLGAVIYRLRRHVGRGVEVAVLFFVTTLGPVLGFIMLYTFIYSFVADHYQYVASIGLITLAAAGMTAAFSFFLKKEPFLKPVLCGVLLAVLGALTWRQCGMYANVETLWETTLAKNPDCWLAYNNLGNALLQNGNVYEAIVYCQKALQINPDDAEACYNLGDALLQKGSVDEAIAYYQKALQIDPGYAGAQNNLGNALLQKGSVDEAITHFQKALQIKPDDAEVCYNLGGALLQKGDANEAIVYCKRALQIKPDSAEAHNNLGSALLQKGSVDEAIAHFQTALRINPDYAKVHINLGNALLQKGSVDEAITHFQTALQINPDYVEAQNNLAWVLATCPQASLRNGNQAVGLAERANQLTGNGNPVVLCTLAAAFAEAGRFPEAVEAAQRALRLAEARSNTALADATRSQLKFYQEGIPFHSH